MIHKKILLFMCILILISPLYGCKDKRELEEQAFVSVIGLDKGHNNNLSITFQMINVNYGGGSVKSGGITGGGGGGASSTATGDQKTETATFDAPDLISARDLANVSIARRITLSHAKVLVIGEELARDNLFFQRIEAVLRDRELRRGIDMIVSKESASEFINNNNPKLEARVNKFYDFMSQRWRETGYVPVSDMNKFMQRTEENTSLFLAVYGTTRKLVPKLTGGYEADYLPGQVNIVGTNPTELIGSAVFKAGKMIGSLTGEETRFVTMLRRNPDVRSMIFTIPDPKNSNFRITLRLIKDEKTKIDIDTSSKKPSIKVKIPVDIEVLSIPSFKNYVEDLRMQQFLRDSITNYFNEKANTLVYKTKLLYDGEPFLWELQARKNFSTYTEYKNYNWPKKYTNATVRVNFDIRLRRFGKQLAPPTLPTRKN